MISYLPLYKEALFLTMRIGWKGVIIAVGIGLAGSAAIHFEIPVVRSFVSAYTQLFRNTPLLIQLFFIYFALPQVGIRGTPEACGTWGLGLLGGAYMYGNFPQRPREYPADSVRKRAKPRYEPQPGVSLCNTPSGSFLQCSGTGGKYDLSP